MKWLNEFNNQSNNIIVGKSEQLKLALTCLLAEGHLLIEDVPGVGKTTMAKFLSKILGLKLSRIQFTNDLLPSDILGVNVFNPNDQSFSFHKGPIFGQVVLADELNRATPKAQSALLQVMEEYKVTIDGVTYDLPNPFIVIATQNPRSQIGTHALPESQIDRFLMKIEMGYPDREAERSLLLGESRTKLISETTPIIELSEFIKLKERVQNIKASDAIANYVIDILDKSRHSKDFQALSPRAGLDLIKAAKAWAVLDQRDYVDPEDIQAVAKSVLGHRLVSVSSSSVALEQDLAAALLRDINVY